MNSSRLSSKMGTRQGLALMQMHRALRPRTLLSASDRPRLAHMVMDVRGRHLEILAMSAVGERSISGTAVLLQNLSIAAESENSGEPTERSEIHEGSAARVLEGENPTEKREQSRYPIGVAVVWT
jgi:hypothetical protein